MVSDAYQIRMKFLSAGSRVRKADEQNGPHFLRSCLLSPAALCVAWSLTFLLAVARSVCASSSRAYASHVVNMPVVTFFVPANPKP